MQTVHSKSVQTKEQHWTLLLSFITFLVADTSGRYLKSKFVRCKHFCVWLLVISLTFLFWT